MIGLGLSLTRAALPMWTPRTLFASGEQGAWYDPSDLSSMFQDVAGTTPVTATGQPVGLMKDKSGRGNHASQSTSTSRPLLQQDANGRYYLLFDGVDDELYAAVTLSAYPVSLVCAAMATSDVYGGLLSVFGSTPPYYEIGKSGAVREYISRIRGATTAAEDSKLTVVSASIPHILSSVFTASNSAFRADGIDAPSLANNNAFGTTTKFRVGNGGLAATPNHWYGGIILARAMTSTEIIKSESYLAAKAGVITPVWNSTLPSVRSFISATYNQPNPHNQDVLSNPPVITRTDETGDGTLTQTQSYIGGTDSAIFYSGGGNLVYNANYRQFPAAYYGASNPGNLGGGYEATAWRARVATNAKKIQFSVSDGATPYRFMVDGQYVSMYGTNSANTGGRCYFAMEFPTSANRVIGVEGSRQEAFELMQFAPSDTVAPIPRNNRRIIFFGDSFTDGQGADNAGDAYSYVAGDMLGFEDIFSSGAGGTGYVRTASSVKFGDRWADITNAGPWDVIVIAGGINDFGYAGITANVTAFMQKIRVGNPSAQMFVVGPWDNMAPAAPQTAYEPTKAAILAGIPANTGIRFIDAEGVVYEKGGDGVHPTTAGHKTLGNWLAAQIKAALGA